jgi:hypothetical protein
MRRVVILAVLAACVQSSGGDGGPPLATHVESFEWPGIAPPQMDILFVLDDTAPMAPYVDRTAAMLRSIDGLWADVGGYPRPDLHVAVATADPADFGRLRGSVNVHGSFIVDENAPDLLTRVTNHAGSLGTDLAELGAVGTNGTASEPLSAARAAIEGAPGFVRENAYLAIVIVSAQDDASGVNVGDVVAWAKALKRDPTMVLVSAVYPTGAPRLDTFVDGFPGRGATVAIDAGDYGDAIAAVQLAYKVILSVPCLATPVDLDPQTPGGQFDCSIELELHDGTRRIVPACPGENCWQFHPDPVNCTAPAGGQIDIAPYRWPIMPTVRGQCVVGN